MQQSHPSNRTDGNNSNNIFGVMILALLVFLIIVILVGVISLVRGGNEPPRTDDPTPPAEQDPPSEGQPSDPSTDGPTDPSASGDGQMPSTPSDDDPDQPPTRPSTPTVPSKSYLMQSVVGVTQELSARNDELGVAGVFSPSAVIVDLSNHVIVAGRDADKVIYPASMTKVMTLLVACERLTEADYTASVTMSSAIISEMQRNNASGWGFAAGDVVTVRDLLYAVALESDGAASIQLAEYVAGSHEAFVALMNEKCKAMGLTSTKFVNATGLHDAGHYTTCREMASIMAAAVDNAAVLALLSEDAYVTRITHRGTPDMRVTFYNTYYMDVMSPEFKGEGAFYRLPAGASVIAAKTGTTDEAGHCLVSCVGRSSGARYVAVTVGAVNNTAYCADLLYLCQTYTK